MNKVNEVAYVPDDLITNLEIGNAALRTAVALLFFRKNDRTEIRATYAEIAEQAQCSVSTAQASIDKLIELGYIRKYRSYRYDLEQGRFRYGTNRYLWICRRKRYTMVSSRILSYPLTHSSFRVLLYLYRCAGRAGRAFPSLRRISGALREKMSAGLGLSKTTVCRALAALEKVQAVVRRHCRTVRNCYACNSYFMTDMVRKKGETSTESGGSTIIGKPDMNTQITGDSILREEKALDPESDSGDWNFRARALYWGLWFDGIGVRVSTDCEQQITI